jgi:ribonuclease J
MLNLIKPKYFMPVHGEYRHLVYHSMLAKKMDIPKENIFILKNGDIIEIDDKGARQNGSIGSGRVFIDGKGMGDVEEMVLRDRLRLAHDGIVLILLAVEKLTGSIVSGPEIISRGFVFEDASQDVINNVRELIVNTIQGLEQEIISDTSLLKAKLRSTLKKYLRNTMERRPMIMPIIIEV